MEKFDFLVEKFDLQLGLDVDAMIVLSLFAIDILLPVLAHHNEWGRVGSLK
jgi:hypothetical protein